MKIIVLWLVSLMTFAAPPERMAAAPQLPGWEETAEQKQERYEAIASDLYQVVYDPAVQPLFRGPKGRAQTAVLVLGVAHHESGFAKDVDIGPCYRKGSHSMRCDGGQSACVMQMRIGAGTTREGWTQEDLFADRKKCFTAGINHMRRSFRACSFAPQELWLTAYAGGTCSNRVGMRRSRELFGQGHTFASRAELPTPDADFLMPAPAIDPRLTMTEGYRP